MDSKKSAAQANSANTSAPETASAGASRKGLSSGVAIGVIALALFAWAAVFFWQTHRNPGQAHLDAGIAAAWRGDGRGAVREWQATVRIAPENALAWQLLGQSYYDAHLWSSAREALSQTLRLHPDTPRLHSMLASCAQHLGDTEAALGFARDALQRNPNDITALEVTATEQTKKGNTAEITRALRRLTVLQPNKVENFIELAQVLMKQNRVAEVIPVLDRVVQLEPSNAEMYALRGIARFYADASAAGQQQCEDDFAHALSIKPTLYASSLYLGRIYRRRGQLEASARFLENATHLNPNKPDAYFDLAAVEEQRRDRAKAEAARQRFQALAKAEETYHHLLKQCYASPDDFDLNLKVGGLALRREDYPLSSFFLERAAHLRPADARLNAALRQLAVHKADGSGVALPSALTEGSAPVSQSGGP